jgi:hypothetical protein
MAERAPWISSVRKYALPETLTVFLERRKVESHRLRSGEFQEWVIIGVGQAGRGP